MTNYKNINFDYLDETFGKDIETQKKYISFFLETNDENWKNIELSINKLNFSSIKTIVHQIKPVYLTLGNNSAYEICKNIELEVQNDNCNLDLLNSKIENLKSINFLIIEELKKWLTSID